MSLDTIMNLSITVESRAPTQVGFGTPLLLGYHTAWLDRRVKQYAQPDEMLDDGFTTSHPLYLLARVVKSQFPSPDVFKVGRRVTALTQRVELTVKTTTEGFKYTGTIGGKALSYTVLAAATVTTIATALASAITALAVGASATSAAGVVTVTTTTAGNVVDYNFAGLPESALEIKDTTVDTTTDDELPAINNEDDDWYGLLVADSTSTATALNVAAWIETQKKLAVVQTADSDNLDTLVTTSTMAELKDSSYARTGAIYHRAIGGNEWLAGGWLAGALTTTPGEATMAFKEVRGVSTDKLLSGQETAILANNGSHYTRVGGLPITFEGKSGSGEFMDTTRFIDWVYARMRETVLTALANNPKIPYTDGGVDIIRGLIMSVIQRGISAGGFAASPEPTVTAPLVKDVAAADRIARILPDIEWTAQLAGAIHRLTPVRGRVSV